jgi:hypothetical protein
MYEDENIEPEFMKRHKSSPFRTPDHYFDSIEDRIMDSIKQETKKKTSSAKVFQLLKPLLGLAASIAIVYLLVYYSTNQLSPKSTVKADIADTNSIDSLHNYAFNISLIDENSLVNAIFGDEPVDSTKINSDEVLAYLSTEMSDLDIYSEIQN